MTWGNVQCMATSPRALLVGTGTRAFYFTQDLLALRRNASVRTAWLELRELARVRPPHRTSFEAVWRARSQGQPLGVEALTFGDTPVSLAVSLLRAAGVGPGDVVVDPLAGRGRVLLAARLLGAEARGIELDRSHVELAAPILARVGVRLDQGDARTSDLSDATCVYLAWTCLPEAARARVARRIPAGARVIAMTFEPPGVIERRDTRWFPWGRVDVTWARAA